MHLHTLWPNLHHGLPHCYVSRARSNQHGSEHSQIQLPVHMLVACLCCLSWLPPLHVLAADPCYNIGTCNWVCAHDRLRPLLLLALVPSWRTRRRHWEPQELMQWAHQGEFTKVNVWQRSPRTTKLPILCRPRPNPMSCHPPPQIWSYHKPWYPAPTCR